MNIRKVALATFIAAILGLLGPFWITVRAVQEIVSTHPLWKWWIAPGLVVVVAFSAIMPTFYLALYRNKQPLQFSKRLQDLSLAAALMLSVITAIGLWSWAAAFGRNTSVLPEARDTWGIAQIAPLLGVVSNFACVLLLVALSRHTAEESAGVPPRAALLSVVTKVAVIVWGIVLIFSLINLVALTPYTYFQIRGYAAQTGRQPPQLRDMVAESLRTLLTQACLLTAPFIVYRSIRRRRQEPALPVLDAPPAQ